MRSVALAAAGLLFLTGCAHVRQAALPVIASASGSVDGTDLIGPPPRAGDSAAELAGMQGPWPAERVAQARADNRFDPFAAFAPVMGDGFRAEALPHLHKLFGDVTVPLGAAVGVAKDDYARPRPFVAEPDLPTCIAPGDGLRRSGSYPSGHAAFGWAWALLLAEIAPSRADAVLQRGRDYGESRVICGVHYPSDVEAGRMLAAAEIARLHAKPAFRRDLDAARAELAAAMVK